MPATANENAFSKHSEEFNGKRSELSKDIKDLGKLTGTLASDAANVVQENATQYYSRGLKQIKNLEQTLENRIQKNPVQSLLIVAGVGLVLGALWNRR
jgi:ElaB/YqjD/DUF883 family membrane-anchored ribosome-binding protein